MRPPRYTSQFERDLRLMQHRGKDIEKLKAILTALINEEPLPERQHDHPLVGNYKGRRECHIEPGWLLIYKLVSKGIIFECTGTHGDLFEKIGRSTVTRWVVAAAWGAGHLAITGRFVTSGL